MATVGNINLTLADLAKRMGPDGNIDSMIAEILSQENEIVDDMVIMTANGPSGHTSTIRTGLPQATWRIFYQGSKPQKSTTAQVVDTIGMLETYSVVDKDLANLADDVAAFRATEDAGFIAGIGQQMAQALFYNSVAVNPERFNGLSPRFNTVTLANAQTANNVIDGGGVGSTNMSVWLVCWSDRTVFGVVPKNTKTGLVVEDVTTPAPVDDGSGGKYQAYQTKYQWKLGLVVKDWRFIVRICNIDGSTLSGATPPNLQRLLIRALNKVPSLKVGRPVFYVNRAFKTWADIQQTEKPTLGFQVVEDVQGRPLLTFRGIPIKLCDQLLNTESRVV